MRMNSFTRTCCLICLTFGFSRVKAPAAEDAARKTPPAANRPAKLDKLGNRLLYTTFFYTAAEVVVHGFEEDTKVRIVSMEKGGTIWSGTVDYGQTVHVKTGPGVFSFVADKKASILVGTPSQCAVVGYWLRDPKGSFRAGQFFTQLPSSSGHSADCRVVVWAWDDVTLEITDLTVDKLVYKGKIAKGKYHEITGAALSALNNHVLQFKADKPAISAQVYYDEGFAVPSADGRGAGRLFYTCVGTITEGVNDLNLISYYTTVKVKVEDIKTGAQIWAGEIKKGGIHTLTLKARHVKVTANQDISVLVAPYKHYKSTYAEHHFGMGGEGSGIETEFLITTPSELWIFSYYPRNEITVTNAATGAQVWHGTLGRGQVQGVHPGHGYYRVKSSLGVSVMGGALACGAEFSPASGLFAFDESLFKVVHQIRAERLRVARESGRKPSAAELDAPLTKRELEQVRKELKKQTGRSKVSAEEIYDRLENMKTD